MDKNWAVLGRFFQSLPVPYGALPVPYGALPVPYGALPVPCGVDDKQGRAGRSGQLLRGAARGAISIKLYIKANMVVFVCVDKNWAVPGRFFQSLPVPCGAGDKQGKAGQPGQPLRGATRGAISIKEILGENRGTCI